MGIGVSWVMWGKCGMSEVMGQWGYNVKGLRGALGEGIEGETGGGYKS